MFLPTCNEWMEGCDKNPGCGPGCNVAGRVIGAGGTLTLVLIPALAVCWAGLVLETKTDWRAFDERDRTTVETGVVSCRLMFSWVVG